MNDKFKILALQAKMGTADFDAGSYYVATPDQMQKFCELIIAKCIEEAGDPADGLILGDTWHDGVRASVWSIRQHFGVEE
jgi:hypothetical protein